MLSDTFSLWFSSLASCFGSRKKSQSRASSPGRNIVVLRDQPAVVSGPSAEPVWSRDRTYERMLERERDRERERARLRRPVSRDSSSVRRQWFSKSSSSTRRLQISGPTDFRHVQSESFQFPPPAARPRPRSFRPIELSIYQPQNRLSPILPHLECDITPPPRAHTANSSRWDASSGTTLTNERSYSSMSFHLPRRHGRQSSGMSDASMTPPRLPRQGSGLSDASTSPPRIPPKSRARAYTAPSTERIVERIASALIEKERLQAEINSLIERQSIYLGSRPSTGYDMRGMLGVFMGLTFSLTLAGLEPMPSIPALPAAAPSFAERLSVDGRPHTAPSHMPNVNAKEKTFELAAAAFHSHPPPHTPYAASRCDTSSERGDEHLERPLAPPLPLVLRPPLRKKKSFSHVSNWLFRPEGESEGADDSSPTTAATYSPRPVKESDGFYQCVAPPEGLPRTSMETSSSVYTWTTGDDEDEAKTVPTTTAWSPEQTPKAGSRHMTPVIGVAKAEFEKEVGGGLGVANPNGHRPLSVGVAF
ncbi:hypothetical protein C8A03DRAFT_16725 [Achaetomium macrosporum]|uniref:Uncharacterized protein n=1 Tax=Achaetomium macrosporum TaxID=79813 RepID=A0AAN7C739_9PEZI|nr:hypothetical protein C8A03DRAFT_16725 [Achaetomium macrosporum]